MHAELAGLADQTGEVAKTLSSSGLSTDAVLQTIDRMTQGQSVMLATNELLAFTGILFFISATLIWLAPRPTRAVEMSHAGHRAHPL
jgi:DHA2 family multidrug resistance protein